MILFTGHGSIYDEFKKYYEVESISLRYTDNEEIIKKIYNCSIIIHNSACIKSQDPKDFCENYLNTNKLINIVKIVNPTIKIINLSSMSILESEFRYKNFNDMSDYSKSKYISELFCLRQKTLKIINVRFSTIFYSYPGKDGLSSIGFDAVKYKRITLYNNGHDIRDFIPIKVAVKLLYQVAINNEAPNVINIASGKCHCFKEFAYYLSKKIDNLTICYKNNNSANNVLSEFTDIHQILPNISIEYNIFDEFDRYISSLS